MTAGPDNFPHPGPQWQSRQAIIFRLAALLSRNRYNPMKIERDVLAESRVTGQNMPLQFAESAAPVSRRRYNLSRAIYVAAIAIAMLGWLWLLAWIATQLA